MNNIPELRFPEFEGEWKKIKFEDCATIINGQVDPRKKPYSEMPNVGPGNIEKFTGKLKGYKLAKEENLISGKYLFTEEDIIYGKINPHFAKVAFPKFKGLCSADTYPIKANKSKLEPEFLFYFLLTDRFTKYTTSVSKRTGIPKVNREELSSFRLIVPVLSEQTKIANFFSLIDQKIEKQQEKVEGLEEWKKGLMQKIFNQEVRFKDDDGNEFPEWYSKQLNDIVTFLKGRNLSKADLSSGGIPCILYGELYTKYNESISEVISKTNADKELVYSEKDDVLIPSSGETPEDIACAATILKKGVALGGDINILRKKSDFNGVFLSYIINTSIKKEIIKVAQGASVVHVYSNSLKKIKVPFPSVKEQTKIANFLSNIGQKIEKEKEKLEGLKEIKKGLMQKMFV